MRRTASVALRQQMEAGLLALGLVTLALAQSAAGADPGEDAAAAARDRVITMQRFVVSATRIEKNPWRYASLPGFEVLSRASEHDTNWLLDALRRGLWIENKVMPGDWLPQSAVPYTIIIDDTDLKVAPSSQLHSRPTVLLAPVDALTWGELSETTSVSSEAIGSHDDDTLCTNYNIYGTDTGMLMDSTMSLERLSRCSPPLPKWLLAGLIGRNSGVFREAFGLLAGPDEGGPARIRSAAGPGTLWVSLGETERILRMLRDDPRNDTSIEFLPLSVLFAEAPPQAEGLPLWESEAALFVRWGLLGPGRRDPVMARAFLELVRRSRREPVNEQLFTDCFGFGYSVMRRQLFTFLKHVLATPTSVDWDMPSNFVSPVDLNEATADQIGRIIGDWLRMKGDFLRGADPEMSEKFLNAAGRVLERAYREDNGLPPDVDPSRGGERSSISSGDAAHGPAVVMKPFVVTADRIHDPRLLAVYGLYEHDVGNDSKAREFLEAAVKARVARPTAYVELAELRYAEAVDKPLGSEGKLSAGQAASVLEPLRMTSQLPTTSDVCNLIVGTRTNCEARLAESDVEEIVRGVALNPRDTDLAYNSALLCAQSGYSAQASKLIDKGLVFTTHEVNREYFEQLRSTLGTPPAK